jgi:hypothetical protein
MCKRLSPWEVSFPLVADKSDSFYATYCLLLLGRKPSSQVFERETNLVAFIPGPYSLCLPHLEHVSDMETLLKECGGVPMPKSRRRETGRASRTSLVYCAVLTAIVFFVFFVFSVFSVFSVFFVFFVFLVFVLIGVVLAALMDLDVAALNLTRRAVPV